LKINSPPEFGRRLLNKRLPDCCNLAAGLTARRRDWLRVEIEVEDDGTILIASPDEKACSQAIEIIKHLTQEAEIGKIYQGKVKKIMDFGAFVEIFPGTDGLVHISEISNRRIKSVAEELREGEEVTVKDLDIDKQGRIRLSRKEALGTVEGKVSG